MKPADPRPRSTAAELAALLLRSVAGHRSALAVALVALSVAGSLAAFVRAGARSVEVFATNLEDGAASVDTSLLRRTHPGPRATAFDVTFALSAAEGEGLWTLPPGARLELQVETQGRRVLLEVLDPSNAGESRVQRASDHAWIDAGPVPARLAPFTVRVRSLDGTRFSLPRPLEARTPQMRQLDVRVTDGSAAADVDVPPRYRIVVPRPLPASETLARMLLLPGLSRVIGGGLVLGLVASALGPALLFRRPLLGATLAVAGVALVHASLRPPLQGEDETSHAGTVELAVFAPDRLKTFALPGTIELLGKAFDQDRVQFNPNQALPLRDPSRRAMLRAAAEAPSLDLARVAAKDFSWVGTLGIEARAPLYYGSFPLLKPLFARLSLLDRVAAYRLLSSLASLVLFAAGMLLLSWAFPEPGNGLLFALAALLPPYLVSLVTTVSNYSLAIGLAQLMAAGLVVTVAGERKGARPAGAAVLLAATLAQVGVFRDAAAFLPAAASIALLGGPALLAVWSSRRTGLARRLGLGFAAAVPLLGGWLLWAGLVTKPERMSRLVDFALARKPLYFPEAGNPVLTFVAQVVLAPLAFALVLALFGLLGRRLGERAAARLAWARTAAGLALVLALYLGTTFTPVPFELFRHEYPGEVRAHWDTFFSTAFSFDQDLLSWKMYWGVFGWADTRYPDSVYAVAKWACVALFLALPLLCRRTSRDRPWASGLLLAFSGLAVSLAFATNTARYFNGVNPWGRFILPWVPIALCSALARVDLDRRREELLRWLLVGAVCFHLWTAIHVVGVRYFVPR